MKSYHPTSTYEQSCHCFALSGDPDKAKKINDKFCQLMDAHAEKYQFGYGLNEAEIWKARQEALQICSKLRDDSARPAIKLYLCAGYGKGNVCPMHFWLEDHSSRNKNVYFIDTMPDTEICIGVNTGTAMCMRVTYDAVIKVEIDGYTRSQIAIPQIESMLTRMAMLQVESPSLFTTDYSQKNKNLDEPANEDDDVAENGFQY